MFGMAPRRALDYIPAPRHARIEDLLQSLEKPDATEDPVVREAVHELVGVTGLLGFTSLSQSLRQFDVALNGSGPAAERCEAAAAAMQALRRQLEPGQASPTDQHSACKR